MKHFCISVSDFSLANTLECGQVFRWDKLEKDVYIGVIDNSLVKIAQGKGYLEVYASGRSITPDFIKSYLDLTLDLPYIYNKIGKDKHIKAALQRFYGLRIIRQPLWECLTSFIISTQNNIPRIKGIINRLSACYGRRITLEGHTAYSFPTPGKLGKATSCRLKECGTGYRAEFLQRTAADYLKKRLRVDTLKALPYEEAKDKLLEFHGVGHKVADCVLLYSAGRLGAFPVDVWIKRIMERLYFNGRETGEDKIRKFAGEYFGEYAGYAQQYLYYYGRAEKIK